MILYHGSKYFFEIPDLLQAKDFKDFGRGFYLTSNLEQAKKWAVRSLTNNCMDEKAYVYEYEFDMDCTKKMKSLELLTYNIEWLDIITEFRTQKEKYIMYDLIYDRMADGQYEELVDAIRKYKLKKVTSEYVLNIAKFHDEKKDQYCFKTNEALEYLKRKNYAEVYKLHNQPKVIKWYKVEEK